MGLFGKKTVKSRDIRKVRRIGALAAFEPAKREAEAAASEQGKLLLRTSLGGGEAPAVGGGELPSETSPPESLFTTKEFGSKELGGIPIGGAPFSAKILDPEKYAEAIKGSAEYRIADRLTRRAEALVSQEGPEWDQLVRLTQLPILESSAMAARENAQAISESMRSGGAGVRTAYATIQKIRDQERINFQRTQAVAGNMMNLIQHGEQFAQSQLGFNEQWTKSLPFQEAWNQMNQNISAMFLEKSLPIMQKQTAEANALKMRMREEKKSIVTGIAMVVGGIALTAFGGGAAGAPLIAGGISNIWGGPGGTAGYPGLVTGSYGGGGGGAPGPGPGATALPSWEQVKESPGGQAIGSLLSPAWNSVQQRFGMGPYALPGPRSASSKEGQLLNIFKGGEQ